MALFNRISILAMAMILLPCIALATTYNVGDEKGWIVGYNYTEWAKDKMFNVGDTLVFVYNSAKHNLYKVNGTEFSSCTIPVGGPSFTSGNDSIVLKTPGNKWYICGTPGHCDKGQKIGITVMDMSATAPAPNSATTASGIDFIYGLKLVISAMFLLLALN